MDSLITALILLVVSALATWMKKKAAEPGTNDDSDSGTPSANQPRPSPRPASWEEELRRLLGEQSPAPPPPMRPPQAMRPPPPLVAPQARQMQPAPPTVIRPVLIPSERRPAFSPARPAAQPAPMPVPVASSVEMSAGKMAPLTQSRQAYERASQLDKKVAEHIDRVPGQRVLNTTVMRREVSPEIIQVVSLFKSARGARQAVLASLILGPPRSVEEISLGY